MDGQIRIYSEIIDMDGDKNIDERSIPCEYDMEGEKLTIYYSEQEQGGIHTKLEAGDFGVKLTRNGFIEAVMLFVPGKMKACQYKTGYGEIDMWIETKEIQKDFKEETLSLNLMYNLYMSGELFSHNRMEIVVFR